MYFYSLAYKFTYVSVDLIFAALHSMVNWHTLDRRVHPNDSIYKLSRKKSRMESTQYSVNEMNGKWMTFARGLWCFKWCGWAGLSIKWHMVGIRITGGDRFGRFYFIVFEWLCPFAVLLFANTYSFVCWEIIWNSYLMGNSVNFIHKAA